ncbi:MAG: cation:dicarboxylase symporter family transporter [Neisseriaceae bacterium]|nr:MAG: cation:dicarboxylase symporter family transporter [Neisseriaceae bacterium]
MNYILIIVFYLVLFLMYWFLPEKWSLSRKILLGLVIGLVFGLVLQAISPLVFESINLKKTQEWFDIVGKGYVTLLRMVVTPLVFISVLSAITKLYDVGSLGKMAFISIGLLLLTTAIAAVVGIFYALVFNLNAENLVQGVRESSRLATLQNNHINQIIDLSIPEWILSLLPQNPFLDMEAARPTSIISIVIFAVLLGISALKVMETNTTQGKFLFDCIDLVQIWVMKLVRLILQLTPYGVMALMTSMVVTANKNDIYQLGSFIVASYLAIISMFLIHGLLLAVVKISPIRFFQKVNPVLAFAFSSRSSAACIPLEIETQTRKLGVPQSIASFVSTFGATIGQNGCAGIYPAMLAIMIAPTVGINPLDGWWLLTLVIITMLSSIGVAGVGGGATFAALIVLTTINLPITIVALLISIEPLIDMGRTALNVSGIMTVGTLTSKILNIWQKDTFDNHTA